jgi:hypothetical protein
MNPRCPGNTQTVVRAAKSPRRGERSRAHARAPAALAAGALPTP